MAKDEGPEGDFFRSEAWVDTNDYTLRGANGSDGIDTSNAPGVKGLDGRYQPRTDGVVVLPSHEGGDSGFQPMGQLIRLTSPRGEWPARRAADSSVPSVRTYLLDRTAPEGKTDEQHRRAQLEAMGRDAGLRERSGFFSDQQVQDARAGRFREPVQEPGPEPQGILDKLGRLPTRDLALMTFLGGPTIGMSAATLYAAFFVLPGMQADLASLEAQRTYRKSAPAVVAQQPYVVGAQAATPGVETQTYTIDNVAEHVDRLNYLRVAHGDETFRWVEVRPGTSLATLAALYSIGLDAYNDGLTRGESGRVVATTKGIVATTDAAVETYGAMVQSNATREALGTLDAALADTEFMIRDGDEWLLRKGSNVDGIGGDPLRYMEHGYFVAVPQ